MACIGIWSISNSVHAQKVTGSELLIQGSACIGGDCVTNETFGTDTERFKESNLRIHFDDTSVGNFPKNDWRILINDTGEDEEEYFGIQDATANKNVFRIDAGAPIDALRVYSSGKVSTIGFLGAGIADPALSLHARDGDTPGLRLQQDNSNGFTPQTWDVAGNETNFFVRNVTDGSILPFKILKGAKEETMVLDGGIIELNKKGNNTDFKVRGDNLENLLFIDASEDKMAIGHNTPEEMLDVKGNIKSTGLIVSLGAETGYILSASDTAGTAVWTALPEMISSVIEDADQDTKIQAEEGTDEDYLRFDVAGSEAMVIDDEGNVGIGITDPSTRLEVDGSVKSTGFILPSGASDGYILSSDDVGVASWVAMPEPSTNLLNDSDEDTRIEVEQSADEDYIRFDVDGSEAMVIDNEGNVGIGTDEPEHALHLVGDLGMTGGVFGVSDARIKKDVQTIDGAMELIRSLDGKTYRFKTDEYASLNLPEEKQYGLIAQEVEATISTLVTQKLMIAKDQQGEEITLKGVNYEQLIPILINAIKEQDQVISQQAQHFNALLSAFEKNSARLTELEAKIVPRSNNEGTPKGKQVIVK